MFCVCVLCVCFVCVCVEGKGGGLLLFLVLGLINLKLKNDLLL